MKVLHDTYLEQMSEELEILNFKLDKLYESAVGTPVKDDMDGFSLLEDAHDDEDQIQILNEEAYQLYTESLNTTMKKIWRAIVTFIKSVFTSTGETITVKDAKNIVEILSNASQTGEFDNKTAKKYIQKGFYMIAGLGTSVDGNNLRDAYESGETTKYVMSNINKIRLDKIPEDSTFRICIGSYSNVNISYNVIYKTITMLRDKGIDGFTEYGNTIAKNEKIMTESIEEDSGNLIVEEFTGDDDAIDTVNAELDTFVTTASQRGVDLSNVIDEYKTWARNVIKESNSEEEAKYQMAYVMKTLMNEIGKTKDKVLAKEANSYINYANNMISKVNIDETKHTQLESKCKSKIGSISKAVAKALSTPIQGVKNAAGNVANAARSHKGATIAIASGALLVGAGCAIYGIMKSKKSAGTSEDGETAGKKLDMAVITYVNETKPEAMAKIRLFVGKRATNIDLNGREKVQALQDDLTKIANTMADDSDKLPEKIRDSVMAFAQNINLFFGGLTSRGKK